MSHINAEINWDWVKKELLSSERMGSKKGIEPILECADICLEKAKSIITPRCVYCEKNISDMQKDSVEIDGKITLSGISLASYLKKSKKICAFLVTIGSGVEDAASRFMDDGDNLEGYLIDRIGSFAVESMSQDLEDKLRSSYQERKSGISIRFSPGYCDWAVEEQFKMDKIIGFSKIGVRLTESCMMVPKKSISAIVGVGPLGSFPEKRVSPCAICIKKDCDYRRTA